MVMNIPRLLRLLSPSYRLAKQKREFESFLRAQGWGKREARQASFDKYRGGRGLR
jgi:hypothetical protein